MAVTAALVAAAHALATTKSWTTNCPSLSLTIRVVTLGISFSLLLPSCFPYNLHVLLLPCTVE
jgi:hypothetical protein